MKSIVLPLGAVFFFGLAGCSTTPLTVAPVGPNPAVVVETPGGSGLRVYSRLSARSDDQNQASRDPVWYQHVDYTIYNLAGNRVEHVDNTIGHYEEEPRCVPLPPGNYLVKASAADYRQVVVPVTVTAGHTTRIHLDDKWNPPADVPTNELVSLPVEGC